jgi:hypothetical protein
MGKRNCCPCLESKTCPSVAQAVASRYTDSQYDYLRLILSVLLAGLLSNLRITTKMSTCHVASVVEDPGLDDRGVKVRFSVAARDILSPGQKWSGNEVDRLPPVKVKISNIGGYFYCVMLNLLQGEIGL